MKLSFDDAHINDWYANRDIFEGRKVTFYITRFDVLNDAQFEKLRVLESEGHEIGCHGFRHLRLIKYLETHTIDEYVAVEIIPAIQAMRSHGFEPKSFAFPFNVETPELRIELEKYFNYIRPQKSQGFDHIEILTGNDFHGHKITDRVREFLRER